MGLRRERGFATRKPMIGERTSLSGLFPFAIHGLASRRLAFPAARLRHLSVITAPPFWIRADRARSALPMGMIPAARSMVVTKSSPSPYGTGDAYFYLSCARLQQVGTQYISKNIIMKHKSTSLAIMAFSAIATVSSQGATLATFDFTGESLSSSAAPITGITVSTVSSGSTFNAFTSATGFNSAAQISGASAFFSGPTTQAVAGNALVFTITATPGYEFTLDGFSFIARSTAQAPADIGFEIGSNSYDFSSSYSNNSTITTISNQSLGLTGLTSATISIQAWNATGSSALQLDNLVATGTVIPEPSSALLGGLGMLALLRRRR